MEDEGGHYMMEIFIFKLDLNLRIRKAKRIWDKRCIFPKGKFSY